MEFSLLPGLLVLVVRFVIGDSCVEQNQNACQLNYPAICGDAQLATLMCPKTCNKCPTTATTTPTPTAATTATTTQTPTTATHATEPLVAIDALIMESCKHWSKTWIHVRMI
ncbi:hypothetical protein DPMN_057108 [Dreissena polymorpha]|uniref:ShKT domain-containing protein n=1 Tax=Dreissena polymorpha TaxID=45954 RepID=A0A9D4CSX8_DREPO|nr:hypothetical protein DPMN_057108 [Dreissena polymorpha]